MMASVLWRSGCNVDIPCDIVDRLTVVLTAFEFIFEQIQTRVL